MTKGLLYSGIDVLAGIDNHLPCKATYEHAGNNTRPNGKSPQFLHADIETLEPEKLIEEIGVTYDDDSLIFVGCSPCQYWSKINTTRTKSAASKMLLNRFRFFVQEFRPGYVVIENVPGLLKKKDEAGLTQFLSFLAEQGYAQESAIITASSYGVPQKRRRFLLIATRLGTNICLPAPDPKTNTPFEGVRVRDHIGVDKGFPAIEAGHRDADEFMHTALALAPQNLSRITLTPKDGGDRTAWKDNPILQINAYRGKDDCFRDVYGRMRWDKPAPTITTRYVSLSNGRFGHPEENRAISIREGATLQTFPKTYVFKGTLHEVARQVGNAVPPELARRVGNVIIGHSNARSTEHA